MEQRCHLAMVCAGALVLAVAGTVACGPRLSSHSSEVLNQLGKAAGFSGTDCPSAQAMVDAYLEEIGRRPSETLSVTVPAFARRAASICPQSHPTIRANKDVDASAVRGIIGGSASGGEDDESAEEAANATPPARPRETWPTPTCYRGGLGGAWRCQTTFMLCLPRVVTSGSTSSVNRPGLLPMSIATRYVSRVTFSILP